MEEIKSVVDNGDSVKITFDTPIDVTISKSTLKEIVDKFQTEEEPEKEQEVVQEQPKTLGKLLYKVGLIADPHFNVDDGKGSDYANDMVNALNFFRNEDVSFIANSGDCGEYDVRDWEMFYEYYNAHAWAPTGGKLRMFTAVGNHDSYLLYSKSLMGSESLDVHVGRNKKYWDSFTGEDTFKDLHFFEYDGKWDEQRVGNRNNQSKLSYWYEKEGVIWVFLAIEYGTDPDLCWGMMTLACNKLDYNNKYVQQMEEYANKGGYTRAANEPFNYQYYNPNLMIWLKDIIENNPDKRIVVDMHHFLPQKAGNGTCYTGANFYSEDRLWPYSDEYRASTTKANSNTLSGLEFYFINQLNNEYKNVTFISGHSHCSVDDPDPFMCVCKYDFNIYKSDGTEKMVGYGKAENWDAVVLTRATNKPIANAGATVHIPSLSKPYDRASGKALYGASEGCVMEVYEGGMKLRYIRFKGVNDSTYVNEDVKSFII